MSQYCIKPTYKHRTVNATLEEKPGQYWDKNRFLLSHYCQYAAYQYAQKEIIQNKRIQSVLDVGCGLGDKLVELLTPHAKTLGIDQPSAIIEARKLHPTQAFDSDDFENPTDKLGQFDFILSIDVIEHLLNPDLLCHYIKKRSRPQTQILISTPERDLYRGKDCNQSPKAEHVREWNQAEFNAYLSQHFTITEHLLLPAFKVGWTPYMIKERYQLFKKRIPMKYCQAVLCTPK